MKSHGPWKIKKTNDVYRDPFLHVWVDDVVRPDGQDGTHVVASMKPGVCVLAVDDQNQVHLTNEFHYGIGRMSLEAVSGGIESGENPDVTAKRELQEELGLSASSLTYLTTVDPFTTIMISATRIYLALGLDRVDANPEGTEKIEHVILPMQEVVQMVMCGEISHAPTCCAVLLAQKRLAE